MSEVPLGIPSLWELCGGILCANLPIIYKTSTTSFKGLEATVKSSQHSHGSHDTAVTLLFNRQSAMHRDWMRLHNKGGLRGSPVVAASNNSAVSGLSESTKLDVFGVNGIGVEEDFKQDVHRETDKIPYKNEEEVEKIECWILTFVSWTYFANMVKEDCTNTGVRTSSPYVGVHSWLDLRMHIRIRLDLPPQRLHPRW